MLCMVICIREWRDLQLNADSEQQICLRKFLWQFLFTLREFLPEIYLEIEEIFFYISFSWRYLILGLNLGLTSNKPTGLLDHSDFRSL